MQFHNPDEQPNLNPHSPEPVHGELEGKLGDDAVTEGFRNIAFAKHQDAHKGDLDVHDIVQVDEEHMPKELLHKKEREAYDPKDEATHAPNQSQNYTVEDVAGSTGAAPGSHATFFCRKCQGALFEIAVKNNHAMQLMTSYLTDDEKSIVQEAAQSYEQKNPDGSYTSQGQDSYNPLTGTQEYQ